MRVARFSVEGLSGYAQVYGTVGAEELHVLSASPFEADAVLTGRSIPLNSAVKLLPPVPRGATVVCMGKNYAAHAREIPHRGPASAVPIVFLKASSAVIGAGEPIELPAYSTDVQLEAELAVVIGRRAKGLSSAQAWSHVFGYTCANDVTARDLQRDEDQWFRAKSFDGSLPLGPWVETEVDPGDLRITARINGEQSQSGRTRDMIHDVADALVMITEVMTLEPGDVVLTGTPSGVTQVRPGDSVEVEIEGIGTLRNPVVAAPLATAAR